MSEQRDDEPTPIDRARADLDRSQRGFRDAQGIDGMWLWRLRQSDRWRRYGPGWPDLAIAIGYLGVCLSAGMVFVPLGMFLLAVGWIAYVLLVLWLDARETGR